MKKKAIILSIICITFFISIFSHNVHASIDGLENENIEETEEKIMMYDAKTKQTTEVDMEELKSVLNRQGKIETDGIYSSLPNTGISKLHSNMNLLNENKVYANPSIEEISNTFSFPYRVTCKLIWNGNNASAALVGPRALLTSAHCVFDPDNNNQPFQNWRVYAGYTNTGTPHYYGVETGWSRVYYSSKWMETNSNRYDWAICELGDPIGTQIGYWYGAISYTYNAGLNNRDVKVIGYPTNKDAGIYGNKYQYKSEGKINFVGSEYFKYSAVVANHMSGAPISQSDNYIVGVHYGTVDNNPLGVRITNEMIDIINKLNN